MKSPTFLDFYPEFRRQFKIEKFISYNEKTKHFTDVKTEPQVVTKFEELEKGCQFYVEGEKRPIRGSPYTAKVSELARIKRIIPTFLYFLAESKWWQKIVIVIGTTQYWKFLLNWTHWALSDVYSPVEKYSQPVREVYRVVNNEKIRDILCAILEFDFAYRYRFQDILVELSKDNLRINPLKEIERLIILAHSREMNSESGAGKFLRYKKYIIWYLRINRKMLNNIVSILFDINLGEVASSVEDLYWQNKPMWNYNFRGIDKETREKMYLEEKNNLEVTI